MQGKGSRSITRHDSTTEEYQRTFKGKHSRFPMNGRRNSEPGDQRYLRCNCGWCVWFNGTSERSRTLAYEAFAAHYKERTA